MRSWAMQKSQVPPDRVDQAARPPGSPGGLPGYLPGDSSADPIAGRPLDPASPTPLFRQLHDRIAAAVLAGRLPAGCRLPSARGLAAALGVARGTVEAAYQGLAGEGYLVMHGAAGTRVDPALAPRRPADGDERSAAARPAAAAVADEPARPFQMGLPAIDAFPYKAWARLAAAAARAIRPDDLVQQPPGGLAALRVEIARHLAIARGVTAGPDEVVVTAGFQGALSLVAGALLRPGDTVTIEDPGYHLARDALRHGGARVAGVPVDGDGADVAAIAAAAPRLAVVTPTHQFPLGVAMSLGRRIALLEWARGAGAFILEDDYDSELRYAGRTIPALKSLDRDGRVLLAGTYSKVLAPGLRTGYLVVPPALAEAVHAVAARLQPPPAITVQRAIAAFSANGGLARHVRRMRTLYAGRRTALAEALAAALGPTARVVAPSGGLHLVVHLPAGTDDRSLVARARSHGLAPVALSRLGVERPHAPGLLVGFANVPAAEAAGAAHRLAAAIAIPTKE